LTEIARIIDRHTDSMADELAEALRGMLEPFGDDDENWQVSDAKKALAKYDAQKGKR
jgi:hypothetical protein